MALIVATVLCAQETGSIVRPLQRVVDGAEALARGDLSVKLDVLRRGEVGAVKHASESISSATQQLAAGNTEASRI